VSRDWEVVRQLRVGLTRQAARSFKVLAARHHSHNEADLINQAMVIFEYLDGQLLTGSQLMLISPGGEMSRVTWTFGNVDGDGRRDDEQDGSER